MPNHSHSPD